MEGNIKWHSSLTIFKDKSHRGTVPCKGWGQAILWESQTTGRQNEEGPLWYFTALEAMQLLGKAWFLSKLGKRAVSQNAGAHDGLELCFVQISYLNTAPSHDHLAESICKHIWGTWGGGSGRLPQGREEFGGVFFPGVSIRGHCNTANVFHWHGFRVQYTTWRGNVGYWSRVTCLALDTCRKTDRLSKHRQHISQMPFSIPEPLNSRGPCWRPDSENGVIDWTQSLPHFTSVYWLDLNPSNKENADVSNVVYVSKWTGLIDS